MLLLCRLQDLEGAEQALVDTHHSACIVKLSAVIRSTEEGDELALGEELVAVFDDLMSTADEIHVVFLKEARNDSGTEGEGNTTIVFAPAGNVLVGIGPEQVAEKTTVRDLKRTSAGEVGKRQQGHGGLTSVGRMTRLICSIELRSGLRPPCMVKIFSSMMAAMGKQLKQSVKVFHSLML